MSSKANNISNEYLLTVFIFTPSETTAIITRYNSFKVYCAYMKLKSKVVTSTTNKSSEGTYKYR